MFLIEDHFLYSGQMHTLLINCLSLPGGCHPINLIPLQRRVKSPYQQTALVAKTSKNPVP